MPAGALKNALYGMALPLAGMRPRWRSVTVSPAEARPDALRGVERAMRGARAVGACVQTVRDGALAECYTLGFARLAPEAVEVTPSTIFRTASIAKLVTAMLVMRLQTLGLLDVEEEAGALLGYPVVSPFHPDSPVTLASLLSHTSGMVDSGAYFESFGKSAPLRALLNAPDAFSERKPGEGFQYSNLAAGMLGSLLEARFGLSFEALAQKHLFKPLQVDATFDLATLGGRPLADSHRVLPASSAPAFCAGRRIEAAKPLSQPDPEHRYALASGALYLSAPDMARLLMTLASGRAPDGGAFLDERSLTQMKTPICAWPHEGERMRHGMGLLVIRDPALGDRVLYGHQGFAYGSVNGVFFDEDGNGFAAFNSGASERRIGHLSRLNRELIACLLAPRGGAA